MNADSIVFCIPTGYRWATPNEVDRWAELSTDMAQVRVGGTDENPVTDLAIWAG